MTLQPAASASDRDLVRDVLNGKSDRFAALVERYFGAVRAVAYGRLGNTADAEDAVQETFVRAYQRLGTLRDRKKFPSWLITIARNCAEDLGRARRREVPSADDQIADSVAETPDYADRERAAIVREHVARLPETAREVLMLHYFAGRNTREIAELLDVSRAAVLKRLQRAREELGTSLLHTLAQPEPKPVEIKTRAKEIAKFALAAGAVHGVQSGSTAAAAMLTAIVKSKAAAGLLVSAAALTAAGAWFAASNPPDTLATNAAPNPAPEAAASNQDRLADQSPLQRDPNARLVSATQATESSNQTSDTKSAEPAIEFQSMNNDPAITEASLDAGPTDFTGPWRLVRADKYSTWRPLDIDIRQLGAELSMQAREPYPSLSGTGTYWGDRIELRIYEGQTGSYKGRQLTVLEGSGSQTANQLELTGTYTDGEHPYTYESDGESTTVYPETTNITATLTRIDPGEISREEFKQQRFEDLRKLAKALRDYARGHAESYPPAIASLHPDYLDDLTPYQPQSGVDLQYLGAGRQMVDITARMARNPFQYPKPWNRTDAIRQVLPLVDHLILYEEYLARLWDDKFVDSDPLVRATYDKYDLEFLVMPGGGVIESKDVDLERDVASWSREQKARSRAMCQNNLKQLGLTLKMSMNEFPGQYGPAGFLTLYPEYMPDPRVVNCPSDDPNAISYALAIPCAGEPHFEALAEAVYGESVSSAQSRVPLAYDLHECSGSGGRNVLFADGHVEYLKEEHFQRSVEPFLDLAVN